MGQNWIKQTSWKLSPNKKGGFLKKFRPPAPAKKPHQI